jgi:hypothetical protein
MAAIRTNARSFAGGEITPEMWGRIDDSKFQTGLATCRNFEILPHGPARNRAGFAFVRATKHSGAKKSRAIPFTFSTTQTMVLEFGEGYIRFHTQGATLLSGGVPYEVATPYLEADLFDLHYVQSADVLTIVHPNYAPRELRRLGATNWTLTAVNFASALAAPTGLAATSTPRTDNPGTPAVQRYVVTAVGADGLDESPPSSQAIGAAIAVFGATNANPLEVSLVAGSSKLAEGQSVAIAGVVGMTQLNGAFVVASYTAQNGLTPPKITLKTAAGAIVDSTAWGAYTSGGTITPTGTANNLFDTGAHDDLTWAAVAGAARYNVYQFSSGLYGYIGQTTDTSFRVGGGGDVVAPDISKTPPITDAPFGSAGNYPGAVSYFEQRRWFAGTTNAPQTIWGTKSGTESNMNYSLPVRDDDRIKLRVQAREANTIRHLVPLQQLMALTSAAEWRLASMSSEALTPSSTGVKPQSYVGANNAQPLIVNNNLIFAAARGGHMRELAYNWQASGYVTGDLSLRAPHLFDGLDIVDMALVKSPHPVVWCVSSGGKLLGLTYVPEQNIGAWHRHDTALGAFESVAAVAEGSEDVLYAIVRRTINGSTVRYVERMAPRRFASAADAFIVDAGLSYSGAAATTFTGLGHLEGCTVSILADGAVMPQAVVSGGSVTISQPASTVQIGLPITADIETLPMAAQIDGSFGQGRQKNANRVWLRVYESSGIFAGPSFDRLAEAKQRSTEPYGSAPDLKTVELSIAVPPSWGDSGRVCIRQKDPLPLTVLSISLEVSIGG